MHIEAKEMAVIDAQPSQALERKAATPMEMIALAISQNADIEKLSKLMDLQERWERNEARKAFVAAMAEFKANPPKLEKIKHVNFSSKSGNTVDYHYAPLDYVGRIMAEALSKHGLSFRWSVSQGDAVSVTCILQHSQGHSESVTMSALIHDDQRMNPIQRLGATVTYLQRYTLLSSTGMATENQDSDGNVVGMTNGELAEQVDELMRCETLAGLDSAFRAAATKALDAKDMNAYTALKQAKDKRKKGLS
jgi:hypothetical protein